MIQKFRWKFIGTSVAALLLVLLITLGGLIGITRIQSQNEVHRVLTALVKNEGHLTPQNAQPAFGDQDNPINRNFLGGKYNPEAVYQYRYFAVTIDASHNVHVVNSTNVYRLKNTTIRAITRKALEEHSQTGNVNIGQNQYAYRVAKDGTGQTIVIFLNETLIFNRFWLLVRVAIVLGICALIVFAVILILVSRKAIKPITDTYHKQQEFITNAGHELKTPLAVISANTEMEEMLGNNSEWNESTKQQVAKLTKLINSLISLARAGETGEITLSKVDFSQIVEETTQDFKSVMKKNNLTYQISIREGIKVIAEKHTLAEILNILLNNARKYCDPGGKVQVKLTKGGALNKSAILRVSNTYKEGKGQDYSHFFDRFYREDESHNSKKGGLGIGLSMARELTEAFRGRISVHHKGDDIVFSVILKIAK
ncbi:HAMP domain-containing histidine kinase [Lactobacillus kefiranofaciens subsp. kefirgranum]|uniref:sensor histidine kinase n=1 Tax=Lactobacillus kefiranofaciens TaxID=267818 RepID=UPI000BA5C71A|nr:HAMP domain-containing sensor histidine kinase [Lactobacillus kefiranofaciens]MCJ2172666.1 HAMP domain-containing histidine kinase [Lactobacillus kefiranofaciens]MCP9331573.1 HAMP domain-containing histidine kinase [Lactobacillus kefiranofaciens]PAK97958.1 two-component sensor histidine kinase [Lactobacillus kefiranofaciens]QNT44740.1 HAMP domain-containing histidine kinase [Lactobacillus kefiranofaciens]URW71660.1 HAMP domain-containing histidine kinase [Lactobacillus kefiranofaciens subsp